MKSLKLPDIDSLKRNREIVLKSVILVLFLSYFFYHSFFMAILLIPLGGFYYKQEVQKKKEKEKEEMSLMFQEMLVSVSASIQAGYAIENALAEARKDMCRMYGEQSKIVEELNTILKGIRNQIPVEQMLISFGKRSKVEEIKDFAQVFSIAKRTGGDLVAIISSTTEVITKKIEVQNEIQMLIASKLFEQQIMNLVPFGIVLYISVTSKGFFDPMYGNLMGGVIMTGCLTLYVFSYWLSQKLIQIKV